MAVIVPTELAVQCEAERCEGCSSEQVQLPPSPLQTNSLQFSRVFQDFQNACAFRYAMQLAVSVQPLTQICAVSVQQQAQN